MSDNIEWDESHGLTTDLSRGRRRGTPNNNERTNGRAVGRTVWLKNCIAVTRLSQVNAEAVASRVRLG